MEQAINSILQTFSPISLEEMDAVKLMNRSDTKFVFHSNKIDSLLHAIKPYYKVLSVNNFRIGKYNTWYYDTPKFTMFTDHQNGKSNRVKIRRREYVNDNISFLEVKRKTNKGQTLKKRINIPSNFTAFDQKAQDFIISKTSFNTNEIDISILNSFSRITLVNKNFPERATIDFNISFKTNTKKIELPFLCIAEIKQEKQNALSDIKNYLLYSERLRPESFSKYCLGALLLEENIKYNTFKPKLQKLYKLTQNGNFSDLISNI